MEFGRSARRDRNRPWAAISPWRKACAEDHANFSTIMGSDCSEKQAELIVSLVKPDGWVWSAPDEDKAGERYTQTLLLLASPHRFIRRVKLAEDKQSIRDISTVD